MTLRPIGATLFIAPDRRDKTDHGLFLPTIAQDDACTGVVLAVGEGCWMRRAHGRLAPTPHGEDFEADQGVPRAIAVRRFQPVTVGDRVVYAPERVQEISFGYGADAPVHYLLDVRDVGAVLTA